MPRVALSTTAHPPAVRRTSSQVVYSEKIGPASKIFTSERSARRVAHCDPAPCDIVAWAHSPTYRRPLAAIQVPIAASGVTCAPTSVVVAACVKVVGVEAGTVAVVGVELVIVVPQATNADASAPKRSTATARLVVTVTQSRLVSTSRW